ncbi:MAG: hypothetical protein GY786_01280 [Proteobacteria bacterium]|nr:hypothetical protein [Pseudomonadota bacterium]
MIRLMKIPLWPMILFAVLLSGCSDKITRYQHQKEKIKPLGTKVKTLILHDDYIVTENGSPAFKKYIIKEMVTKMGENSKFNLVHIKSGSPLPLSKNFSGSIVLIGNIWSQTGNTSGQDVTVVRRTQNTKTQRKSWDELEHRKWRQTMLQTVFSLNFIEITDKTKLLRGVITISNDKHYQLYNNKRRVKDSQSADLFEIPKLTPGYIQISVKSSLDNLNTALDSLAQSSINKSFESL